MEAKKSYLQEVEFVRTCLKCNNVVLPKRDSYMWMGSGPFVATDVRYASKQSIAKQRLAKIYLANNAECMFCGNKGVYNFSDISIDGRNLYELPKDNCAFAQLRARKPQGEFSNEPLSQGVKATKYIILSFYDLAIKLVSSIDERMFIPSEEGEFTCKIYCDTNDNYITSVNDINYRGFGKTELLDYIKSGRDFYIKRAGVIL